MLFLAFGVFSVFASSTDSKTGDRADLEVARVEKEWKERHGQDSPFPFFNFHPYSFKSGSGGTCENAVGEVFHSPNNCVKSESLIDVLHMFDCPVGIVALCRGPFDLDRLANLDVRVLHVEMDEGGYRIGSPESLVGLPLQSFAWKGESWTNLSVLARIPSLRYVYIDNDGPICDASPLLDLPLLESLLLGGDWTFQSGRFQGKAGIRTAAGSAVKRHTFVQTLSLT